MMKKIITIIGLIFSLNIISCNEFDNNLQDPNNISPELADLNLVMTGVQVNFAYFFESVSGATSGLTRQAALTSGSTYNTAVTPPGVDGIWEIAYQSVLSNTKLIIEQATPKGLTTHIAVAELLQAYTYITLVDVFGDVPQTEALSTTEFNPKADPGANVYAYALKLIDDALVQLAKTGAEAGLPLAPANDFFYKGNRTLWATFARTLKLKALLNLSVKDAAGALAQATPLLSQDLIDTEAENFTFKFGKSTVPNTRNLYYNQYYGVGAGSANGYINNGFMYQVYGLFTKGVQDPRWRYYFYRQVGSIKQAKKEDSKSVGCSKSAFPPHFTEFQDALDAFCTFEPGFYGRDHGDNSGTNPDSRAITCVGAYPYGGALDTNPITNTTYSVPTVRGQGADGAGISPIFMSFYLDFMKAELAAKTGNTAGAKAALLAAIQNSITQVKNFATSKGLTLPAGLEPSSSDYLEAVAKQYDASTTKLDIISREYYIALFGNALEQYNLYRRIPELGKYMSPTLSRVPGAYIRSLPYPSLYSNLNTKAKDIVKDNTKENRVFWDVLPGTLK